MSISDLVTDILYVFTMPFFFTLCNHMMLNDVYREAETFDRDSIQAEIKLDIY